MTSENEKNHLRGVAWTMSEHQKARQNLLAEALNIAERYQRAGRPSGWLSDDLERLCAAIDAIEATIERRGDSVGVTT